jgi:glucokinase
MNPEILLWAPKSQLLNKIFTMSSSKEKIIIGVDVGGTKIKAGAVNIHGDILGKPATLETIGSAGKEEIYARITDSIKLAAKNSGIGLSEVSAIGLGVTGPLDNDTGTILECPQLPTMHFFPLRDRVFSDFRIPVFMDNDANALLLGESVWGAGKGYGTTLGFTLGTGLGCAIVFNNRLFSGANGLAGEIWPSPYKHETIEDIVSGRGISALYKDLTGRINSAKEISELAKKGDQVAINTWQTFGEAFGFAVAWGINMIDPSIVIVGGSIAGSMDLFYDSMENIVRKNVCPVPASKTRIVKAALDDNAGFIGAACLALQ